MSGSRICALSPRASPLSVVEDMGLTGGFGSGLHLLYLGGFDEVETPVGNRAMTVPILQCCYKSSVKEHAQKALRGTCHMEHAGQSALCLLLSMPPSLSLKDPGHLLIGHPGIENQPREALGEGLTQDDPKYKDQPRPACVAWGGGGRGVGQGQHCHLVFPSLATQHPRNQPPSFPQSYKGKIPNIKKPTDQPIRKPRTLWE